jgi:transposase
MVFDAHARGFAFFGGVPLRGIYDNMKTAVTTVFEVVPENWTGC